MRYQRLVIDPDLRSVLIAMLDDLGEVPQTLSPDSAHPLVVHAVMGQITLVESGFGYASLAGDTILLEPGDLLILASGCEHSFLCPAGTLVLRHWHWPRELLNSDREILAETFRFGAKASARSESDEA